MKIIVEEGDMIAEMEGGLPPGVYVVDGKDPLSCGIDYTSRIYFPGTWKETIVEEDPRFVLDAKLLHVKERGR